LKKDLFDIIIVNRKEIIMNIDIDISKVTLKTKRLVLRPWRMKDLNDFFEYASVDGVGQMAGWQSHKNIEETKEILNSFMQNRNVFAIEYQGKVIGSIGIGEYDEEAFPEFEYLKCRSLGYVLSKDYWGQGLMSEAVKKVVSYLFDEMDLDLILCESFLYNKQSIRVQEKCGFKYYKDIEYLTQTDDVVKLRISVISKVDN
jgi:ribosomal-protein-alanine N-acetyltransferase